MIGKPARNWISRPPLPGSSGVGGGIGEYPVLSPLYRQTQLKAEVDRILRQHDSGSFLASAGLVDEMKTDDRLLALIGTRSAGLLSCPVHITAAGKRRKDRIVAERLGGNGTDIQGIWRDIVNPRALRTIQAWGWFLGVGVAEQIVDQSTGMVRLVPWHPSQLRWDWAYDRFVFNTQQGVVYLPRPDVEKPDGKWFIYCPWGVKLGWRDAFIRAVAEKYLILRWCERDWARFCEKHGLAIIEAKVPSGTSNLAEKEQYLAGLENLGSEGIVLSPQGDDGKASYGIELKEAVSNTWQAFQAFKQSLHTDFAVLMLGQNLTTEAKGGGLGGGEAQTHDQVRGDVKAVDAEIGPDIKTQILGPYVENNYGDRALTPTFEFQTQEPDDSKKLGDGHLVTAQAIKAYQDAGVEVDGDEMAIAAGAPMLTPEEAASKRADREQDAADAADAAVASPGDGAGGTQEPSAAGDDPAKASLRALTTDHVRERYTFQGFPIAVENKAGSMRYWKDGGDNTVGKTLMLHDYGFIEGVLGSDKDELDCYVGPDENAGHVHVVHQLKAPGYRAHDEDKTMLGFASADEARAAYLAHRNDGEKAFGSMSVIPLERFRAKLQRRAPTTTSKIHATAPRAGVVKLRGPRPAGSGKTATYINQLDAAAQRRGAAAIRPQLEAVLAAVREGSSWEDVKARCLAFLKTSDPKAIAETMSRARIMAHLSGRAGVLEGI